MLILRYFIVLKIRCCCLQNNDICLFSRTVQGRALDQGEDDVSLVCRARDRQRGEAFCCNECTLYIMAYNLTELSTPFILSFFSKYRSYIF